MPVPYLFVLLATPLLPLVTTLTGEPSSSNTRLHINDIEVYR